MMEALVINLDRATERLAFQREQLDRLRISWKRLRAVESNEVDSDLDYWSSWSRPLRKTEMACLRSHQAAWKRCLDQDNMVLILEDDVVLHPDTPEFLWTLQQTEDARIDHVTLETRSRKKVIQKKKHQNLQIHKLIRDRSGAAAYVLKPHGAKKLLDASQQACALADALISDNTNLSSWQAVPALAAQMDQFETDKKDHEVTKQSQIDQEPRPTNKSVRQILRRILGEAWRSTLVLRPGYLSVEVPFKNVPNSNTAP